MNTEPYEKLSVRSRRLWSGLSEFTGLNEVALRAAFVSQWFGSCRASEWAGLIRSGKVSIAQITEAAHDRLDALSVQEITKKQAMHERAMLDQDHCDLSQYRLKQIIRVGDEWVCNDTKTFLSGGEYLTAGKLYRILELSDTRDDMSEFSMITETNMPGERNYASNLSVMSLWRDGKEVWNWDLSYYATFAELYPDTDPAQLEGLRQQCLKHAAKRRPISQL